MSEESSLGFPRKTSNSAAPRRNIKFDEVPCLVWWKERVKVYKDGYGYGTVLYFKVMHCARTMNLSDKRKIGQGHTKVRQIKREDLKKKSTSLFCPSFFYSSIPFFTHIQNITYYYSSPPRSLTLSILLNGQCLITLFHT